MADGAGEVLGRCWGCEYSLRGMESGNCPECGRGFDRGDRRSVNFGRPVGRVGRWAMAAVGWPVVLVAAVGCGLIWATVRWPVEGWRFAFYDVGFYGRAWEWWGQRTTPSWVDASYSAGLWLAALGACGWALKSAARGVAVLRHWPPRDVRGRYWRRTAAVAVLLGASVAGMGVGWPYRLGQRWAAEYEGTPAGAVLMAPSFAQNWIELNDNGAGTPMCAAAVRYGSARGRTAGLKWVVESWPADQATVREAARVERDAGVLALEIRLLGLGRDGASAGWLVERLSDVEPEVRAAAADALGLLYAPWRDGQYLRAEDGAAVASTPPIRVGWLIGRYQIMAEANAVTPPPADVRAALERVMVGGATAGEREAAARALLPFPPKDYALRYAEWGVFLADGRGGVALLREQLDEVPPFVRRVGNPLKEIEGRVTAPPFVGGGNLKPVIHLTAGAAMSADVEVYVRRGRPWVAHPAFDDVVMLMPEVSAAADAAAMRGEPAPAAAPPPAPAAAPAATRPSLAALDLSGAAAAVPDLREGFSWLAPAHRSYAWGTAGVVDPNASIGVRWQGLIVSPTRLAWMTPAAVGRDPRFAWWEPLRGVGCSWVASRGESERFLYYDGPTTLAAPVSVALSGDRLTWSSRPPLGQFEGVPGLLAAGAGAPAVGRGRRTMFVNVTKDGVRGQWLEEGQERIGGERAGAFDAAAEFKAEAARRGLRDGEAGAMTDCWTAGFFRRPGRRCLTFLTEGDYAEMCPARVTPAPTEVARVGVIWTEFGR